MIETNKDNTLLICADSHGFIYVWNIDGYCTTHKETQPPECKSIHHKLGRLIIVFIIN